MVVIAALIGYQLGQKREKQDWAEKNAGTSPPVTSGSGVKDPLNGGGGGVGGVVEDPNAPAGGGVIRPAPRSPAPVPAAPQLQDGWNYLVAAQLRRSDAEEAAKYLADNGIAVELRETRRPGVDRGGSGANNGTWQLWVLQGVPGGSEYSKHATERTALKTKVEMLGRTWKAQNRKAPTDFAGAYWQLYKN